MYSNEASDRDERLAEFLFELFVRGVLTLDGVQREGFRFCLPTKLAHGLMVRCIDALYVPHALEQVV